MSCFPSCFCRPKAIDENLILRDPPVESVPEKITRRISTIKYWDSIWSIVCCNLCNNGRRLLPLNQGLSGALLVASGPKPKLEPSSKMDRMKRSLHLLPPPARDRNLSLGCPLSEEQCSVNSTLGIGIKCVKFLYRQQENQFPRNSANCSMWNWSYRL